MKKILAIALLMVIHHQLIMAAPNTTPENFTPEQLHQLELDEQQLARVNSRAAQGIDPQLYADARNLAKSTGHPIDPALRYLQQQDRERLERLREAEKAVPNEQSSQDNIGSGKFVDVSADPDIQLQLTRLQRTRAGFLQAANQDPDVYAQARRLAQTTGQSIDSILRDPKPQQVTDQWSSLETVSPSTAQMFRDMDKAKLAGRSIEEPKFGSKEWAMGITQKFGDSVSKPIEIFMRSVVVAIVICLFAFFLIFSIFPNLIKKFPIKRKFRLASAPFFPSLIIFLFADLLPEFEFDGKIEYDARYYVLIFAFLLSCWIVWRRAKDQQMAQNNNA